MHDEDLAVYVFANLDHAELRHAILFKTIDLYAFDDNGRDWHGEVFNLYSGLKDSEKAFLEKQQKERIKETVPSLPLEDYVGTYSHKMLGKVMVAVSEDVLQINFNDYKKYRATHWHYDTFKINKDPKWRSRFVVTFALDSRGKSSELNVMGEIFRKIK